MIHWYISHLHSIKKVEAGEFDSSLIMKWSKPSKSTKDVVHSILIGGHCEGWGTETLQDLITTTTITIHSGSDLAQKLGDPN